jgi:hypothetical protein
MTAPSAIPAPRRRACGVAAAVFAVVCAALALGACGKSGGGTSTGAGKAGGAQGSGVSSSAVAVIKGWADALRDGHPRRAAAYWARPSVMVNGPDSSGRVTLIHIDSEHDALLADATLSCGATLRRTARRGAYVRATFALSVRKGPGASTAGCSGPASVDFAIRAKRIVRWLRAPSDTAPPPSGQGGAEPRGEPAGGAAGAQSI